MITARDKAYAAGLFDGEGCIMIAKRGRTKRPGVYHYSLVCAVKMCDEEPSLFLQGHWGGSIHHRKGAYTQWRDVYEWVCQARRATNFLVDIYPDLKLERVRLKARLAMEFQEQKRTGSECMSEAYARRQRHYYELMRQLNKRGGEGMSNSDRRHLVNDGDIQLVLA